MPFDTTSELYNWLILPLFIYVARITDVSMGTLRIIFISRGKRNIAPLLGFVEILLWLVAIGQIIKNLNNFACYLAYAGGFATGNYLGLFIEKKLALGMQVVRIITKKEAGKLIEKLRDEGFGITTVDAEGATGPVKIIFTVIKRKHLAHVMKFVNKYNPNAFYSIEDVRSTRESIYHNNIPSSRNMFRNFFNYQRKGK